MIKGGNYRREDVDFGEIEQTLKRLESGKLNTRNTDERKGVSSEELFDFVDIDDYVMPTLHLMLGIVNYLYKNNV